MTERVRWDTDVYAPGTETRWDVDIYAPDTETFWDDFQIGDTRGTRVVLRVGPVRRALSITRTGRALELLP